MIKINKEKTASFDVDAEKCFTPLCPNELPVVGGDEIVDELNKQAEFAKFRVGSKDAHPLNAHWEATKDHPQFSKVDLPNVDMRWNRHGIVGTYGGELLDELPHPTEYDFFVWKGIEKDMHPYGACYHDLDWKLSTGVMEFLRLKGVEVIIVGGLATDYCVLTTVRQLVQYGFYVIVNLGACRGINEDSVDDAIERMKDNMVDFVEDASEFVLDSK